MYHPSAIPFSGLLQKAQDHTAFQPNILWFPPTAVFISSRIIFPFIFNNFPLTSCIPDDLGKPYSTPWQIPTAMDEFANLPGSLFPLPYPSYLTEFRTHSPPQWGWHSPAHTSLVFSWNAATRIKARRHQHHHTTGLRNRKSPEKNKNQVNWTERYRPYIQTLLFWDGIHLCNRGGFSQTLLRPEICCQTHTQRLLPSAP